jgi:long-chain acyl-CoA synthetase
VPVTLLTTPLFHVTANNCGAYAATAGRRHLVLMYRWDAGEALRMIERERVTGHERRAGDGARTDQPPGFRHHRYVEPDGAVGRRAQVPPDLVHKIEDKVASARPSTGYGMTETCGIITSISATSSSTSRTAPARPCPTSK